MFYPVNEKWCSKITNQADTLQHLVSQIFILIEMSEGVEREKECEAADRTEMLARLLSFVTLEICRAARKKYVFPKRCRKDQLT